jgi:hypothetical protein
MRTALVAACIGIFGQTCGPRVLWAQSATLSIAVSMPADGRWRRSTYPTPRFDNQSLESACSGAKPAGTGPILWCHYSRRCDWAIR